MDVGLDAVKALWKSDCTLSRLSSKYRLKSHVLPANARRKCRKNTPLQETFDRRSLFEYEYMRLKHKIKCDRQNGTALVILPVGLDPLTLIVGSRKN
jgi:hypothetical protein